MEQITNEEVNRPGLTCFCHVFRMARRMAKEKDDERKQNIWLKSVVEIYGSMWNRLYCILHFCIACYFSCNIKQIQFIDMHKVFILIHNLQTDKTYRRTDTLSQPSCTRAVSGHCDCAIFKNLFSSI
jgi:hypothetical protein